MTGKENNNLELTDLLEFKPSPILTQSTRIIAGRLIIAYSKLPQEKISPITHQYNQATKTLTIYIDQDIKYQLGSACDVELIDLPKYVEYLEVRAKK